MKTAKEIAEKHLWNTGANRNDRERLADDIERYSVIKIYKSILFFSIGIIIQTI